MNGRGMATPMILTRFELYTRRFSPVRKLGLIVEIVVSYVRIRRQLSRRGVPETLEIVRDKRLAGRNDPPNAIGEQLAGVRLGRAVTRVCDVLPSDPSCLIRSLVLSDLLGRRRVPSALVIGVTSSPTFSAHAWVETRGVPLLPPKEEEYERLTEL